MNMSAPVRRENLWKWLGLALSLCWVLAVGLLPSVVPAQDALRLEAIDVQPLPGQQVELRLRLSGAAPEPMTFTIDDPARISLDLPNTTLGARVAPARRQRRPADDDPGRRSQRPHARRHEPELDGSVSNASRRQQRLRVARPRARRRRRAGVRRATEPGARCAAAAAAAAAIARSATSTSAAAPTAPAKSSSSSTIRARRSTSARKAAASSSTSRTPRCRRSCCAGSTSRISRRPCSRSTRCARIATRASSSRRRPTTTKSPTNRTINSRSS